MNFTKGHVNVPLANGEKKTVEGYNFVYEGIAMVAHKNIHGTGWTVSEKSTGLGMGGTMSKSTRKAAVEVAIARVEEKGVDKTKEAIQSVLKDYDKKIKEMEQEAKREKLKQEEAERQARQEERLKKQAEEYAKKIEAEAKEEAARIKAEAEAEAARIDAAAEAEAKRIKEEAEKAKAKDQEPKMEKKKWNIGQFFKGIASMEELKKAYKKFAKWLHPDVSDYENADEAFKAMKEQYEKAEKLVKMGKTVEAEQTTNNVELDKILAEAVAKINHLEGIIIKIRGSWVWVSGIAASDKDKHEVLKAAGFKFGAKAKEWYFAAEVAGTKKRRGKGYSAEDLKNKFGEVEIKGAKKRDKVAEIKGAYQG